MEEEQATVLDCRFPYEFQGGHVKGAINIFSRRQLAQFWQEYRASCTSSTSTTSSTGTSSSNRSTSSTSTSTSSTSSSNSSTNSAGTSSTGTNNSNSSSSTRSIINSNSSTISSSTSGTSDTSDSSSSSSLDDAMPSPRRRILVMCEFSQARGPKILSCLQELVEQDQLPESPQLSLLEGGYQRFYGDVTAAGMTQLLGGAKGYRRMMDPPLDLDVGALELQIDTGVHLAALTRVKQFLGVESFVQGHQPTP